ncbi:hypothetical protein L195_g024434 [Trifolium pratense]|uniref:Uncharacterized protein n=1 Tax=Trifolium pratense TaxID=57577 RepID=A0A2K3NDN4_TRIPR|nr:hypothetical protein L195_g024434 [Trifolium pratense]
MEGQDPQVYFNVEKQAMVVQPLNKFLTLAEQINASVTDQINIYVDELNALKSGEDPKHAMAIVVFEEEGANKVVETNRGRQIKNTLIGSISVSFELPQFCYNSAIDIERILATRPHKKDVLVTPLRARRFSVRERAKNWKIKWSLRVDNRTREFHFTHLTSNKKFRSKPEVVNFILYEALPKPNKKRRSSTVEGSSN